MGTSVSPWNKAAEKAAAKASGEGAARPDAVLCVVGRVSLTLAHFTAQLEDLRGHIAHVRAQLEHLRDTSTGQFGLQVGQSELKLSGQGQSKLKLSGNGNECKPLVVGSRGAGKTTLVNRFLYPDKAAWAYTHSLLSST